MSQRQPDPHPLPTVESVELRRQHGARVEELFSKHNRDLVRFLTSRLRNPQEAKEVAQEAYVRMLQLDAPSGIGYLRAFLFKTAANLASNRLRNAARRGLIDEIDFFDGSDAVPSPESGVAAHQELQHILGLIDQLPPKCRYAFVMHRFYGHELAEVAQLMNLSERMVRLYVERALAFCEEHLQDVGGLP